MQTGPAALRPICLYTSPDTGMAEFPLMPTDTCSREHAEDCIEPPSLLALRSAGVSTGRRYATVQPMRGKPYFRVGRITMSSRFTAKLYQASSLLCLAGIAIPATAFADAAVSAAAGSAEARDTGTQGLAEIVVTANK